MNSPHLELDARGWTVGGMPGWPDHRFVGVRVELVRGRPALVAFGIEPVGPSGDAIPLTAERLSRVPARDIANAVAQMTGLGNGRENAVFDALRDLRRPTALPPYTRGGSDEWHRAILAISADAQAHGRSAIAAIVNAAGVGRDRAKQYSAAAKRWEREAGSRVHAATPPAPDRNPAQAPRRTGPLPTTQQERDTRTGRSRGRGSIDTRKDES